jgi:hypothetical protein
LFTEAVRLDTSRLTKFALWQCLECKLVFVEPRIQSRDHSNVADRRRDLPLRVANPAATLAERPERPLAAERRHLLSMVNALSRRTLDFLKTPVPASVHRAHRRRLAAHRQQLRRYMVRWRTAQQNPGHGSRRATVS